MKGSGIIKRWFEGNVLLIFTVIVLGLLLFTAYSSGGEMKYCFGQQKKILIDVNSLTFNEKDELLYACSSRNLYVLNSHTDVILKNITILGSNYSSIYQINGLAFNSKTYRLYIGVYPNEVLVMNAQNYKIIGEIKVDVSTPVNPNYESSGILVDEKTNMIYVKTQLQDSSHRYSFVGKYIVIDGKTNSVKGLIPGGIIDFEHNYLWTWGMSNFTYYNLTAFNLQTMDVVKRIVTDISFSDAGWENP